MQKITIISRISHILFAIFIKKSMQKIGKIRFAIIQTGNFCDFDKTLVSRLITCEKYVRNVRNLRNVKIIAHA